MTENKEAKMKNGKFHIENPIFWVLLMIVAYQAMITQYWPSMLVLLFFIGIKIPNELIQLDKRDNPPGEHNE